MKQYRYTSQNFVPEGETGDADAVMDANDLAQIKKLAGLVTEGEAGMWSAPQNIPNTDNGPKMSPIGSNISTTAEERNKLEQEYCAQPGTDLWFIINFTKPYLNGSVLQKVEQYLKQNPEYRPKRPPGG